MPKGVSTRLSKGGGLVYEASYPIAVIREFRNDVIGNIALCYADSLRRRFHPEDARRLVGDRPIDWLNEALGRGVS